jgi:hypothetical protein
MSLRRNSMRPLFASATVALAVLMIANAASARDNAKKDYTPQECAKLEREYKALQNKEKLGTLTAAERARMGHIDDVNNIYCS